MEGAQRTRPSGPWSRSRPYLGFLYVGGPRGPLPVTNRADGPCSHRKPEGGGMGTLFSISPTGSNAETTQARFPRPACDWFAPRERKLASTAISKDRLGQRRYTPRGSPAKPVGRLLDAGIVRPAPAQHSVIFLQVII